MAYDWVRHVREMAHLFKRDGSGYTRKLYAEDAHGKVLERTSDPLAVKYSLVGANGMLIWNHAHTQTATYRDLKAMTDHGIHLIEISVKLWTRAGVPPHNVRTDAPSMGILRFGRDNDWPVVEKVLRNAYAIAKGTQR